VKPETPAASEDARLTAILSPPLESDVEALARWYDKATMLAGSPVPLSDLFESSDLRRILVLTDGVNQAPFGLMTVALGDPEPGWATVDLLAIARQEERDMAAMAIAMLEAYLQREVSHMRAAVPPDVGLPAGQAGLALYFWLRLGYRPAVSGERLWMTSDLEA
jgi:hypothetical protein